MISPKNAVPKPVDSWVGQGQATCQGSQSTQSGLAKNSLQGI